MKFHWLTQGERRQRKKERRASLNKWHWAFAWLPRRFVDWNGKEFVCSRTIAWLERVSRRTRDHDGMRPYIYGPAGWFLTQPGGMSE